MKWSTEDSTILESALEALFTQDNGLHVAARYALFSGGKRLRPKIVLAVAETYGIPLKHALLPACAIELVHTYSLVHDDLPCMDNDDVRRGKPTLHKVFPEWHALLTGDFLLTYAFELLAKSTHLSAQQRIDLVEVLSSKAGEHGMIGGQLLDLQKSPERQEKNFKKTACLIIAAFECGGIIAQCDDIELLREIGADLGLAFQMIDDVLDGDIPEVAQEQAHQLYQRALSNIRLLAQPAPLLEELAHALIFRSS